ncbi:MAG: hypothetical protein PHE58_06400, partial [Candidatus Omnitrophica bacterium]|nr:hypothetical protein [Candidatus Omnitrophota bacterium]
MKLATGFKRVSFVLLIVLIFSAAHSVLWAKNKNIQFLPRNETVDIVSRDLGVTLHEVSCASAEDIFKQAALCSYCVDYLKADRNCPDCCLSINNPQKRFIHCTKDEDSDFPCKDLAFYSGSCSALPAQGCFDPLQKCNDPLPQCQQRGCPNLEPNQQNTPCIKDGNNAWFCTEDKLPPKSAGCVPDSRSGLQNCAALIPVYSKIEKKPCPDDASKDCFRYEIKSEALDCKQKCDAFGPLVEKCTQKLNCCRSTTCGDGFSNHCNTTLCQERLAWPECDKMTAQQCIELQANATNCLTDSS